MKNNYFTFNTLLTLATCITMHAVTQGSTLQESLLHDVLIGHLRDQFSPFLDTVLRQGSSQDFFAMIDMIQETHSPLSDAEWYHCILHYGPSLKPLPVRYTPLSQIDALQYERAVLSEQIKQLIDPAEVNRITTGVEIGKLVKTWAII
jgi:hypothetical protein